MGINQEIEELWTGGPRLKEDDAVFKLCTDSVLLAFFAGKTQLKRKKYVIDLGCGSGVISILMAWNDENLLVDGVEILPEAARLAEENINLNGLSGRVSIIEGDMRDHRELLTPGIYDLTVSNPPYYASGSGKRSANDLNATARTEDYCSLNDLCKAASYLTRWGGSFVTVHKPERLSEVFLAMTTNGFEPKRLRFTQHTLKSKPNLVFIESRRGGKPTLSVEAPLILKNNDGRDSVEIKKIYHR